MISTFGEVFEVDPKIKIAKNSDVPFIEMADIEPWARTVGSKRTKKFAGGSKFLDGDVLVARITPSLENGKTSIYRASKSAKSAPAGGSTEFIVVRGIAGRSLSEFAYYLLRTADLRSHLIANMNGSSGRQRVQADALRNYVVDLPSIDEQRRIAEVLGALDDKIESNQNLAEIILSLIGAQIDCELSDGSGDLFPVSELAKFVNGGAYTKEASGTGRMVIRIADLNSGPSASTIYNDIEVPGDRLAHFGDLLMSWSGSLGIYVWVRDEAIVNQHIFKVICTNFPAWLVHNRLNAVLHRFRSIAADKATTMGHIQRKHLDETFVEVPVTKLGQLSHLCAPLWNRFISAQLESMQLAALRDALLPELMSGRMRVDEAGCLVSEALDEEVRSV